jgi:hypothetical protein
MGEIMTDKALSVGFLLLWITSIIVSLVTKPLVEELGGGLFLFYALMCFGVTNIFFINNFL